MQIVLDTRGLQMSVRNACFFISDEKEHESRIIHPDRIDSFLITAPARISSPALILAAEYQIPVIICNQCGRPMVRMWSSSFLNTSLLRRKQYRYCDSAASLQWASELIEAKITGQLANLNYLSGRHKVNKNQLEMVKERVEANTSGTGFSAELPMPEQKKKLLSIEAHAASYYWQLAGINLPEPFTFSSRVKRNPADAFNASVNYLYGMLRNQVESAILSFGLDPALGIFHRDGYRMPSLVFDLMEPFRPVVDRLLFTAILNKSLPENYYDNKAKVPLIVKEGRLALISLFMERLHTRAALGEVSLNLDNLILHEVKRFTHQIKAT
jgi:CRISPR-associated protein Cas1